MPAQMDPIVLQECMRLKQSAPDHEIPVIITLSDWAQREVLEGTGLRIAHLFENISAVSGTARAVNLERISSLDGVERIEYDGTVRATPNSADAIG